MSSFIRKIAICFSCYACYVVASGDDGHQISDIMMVAFFFFTTVMIALHCYLKTRQRRKSERKLKRSFETDVVKNPILTNSYQKKNSDSDRYNSDV